MLQVILNALKAKFPGVSEQVLSRIAKNLAKTAATQEQADTAVEGVTLQQVIDSYADSRATEATQTAIHNYETKHGLKDGVKIDDDGGGAPKPKPKVNEDGDDGNTPEWARALIEANKALTERMAKMEGERVTKERKQQLSEVISKLPDNLRKAYGRTPVDGLSEEEFTALLGEVTTEVSGIVNEANQKGAVFGRPNRQAGGNGGSGDLTKEQQAAIAQRNDKPADGQQPF